MCLWLAFLGMILQESESHKHCLTAQGRLTKSTYDYFMSKGSHSLRRECKIYAEPFFLSYINLRSCNQLVMDLLYGVFLWITAFNLYQIAQVSMNLSNHF